jgi:hypothetical protein
VHAWLFPVVTLAILPLVLGHLCLPGVMGRERTMAPRLGALGTWLWLGGLVAGAVLVISDPVERWEIDGAEDTLDALRRLAPALVVAGIGLCITLLNLLCTWLRPRAALRPISWAVIAGSAVGLWVSARFALVLARLVEGPVLDPVMVQDCLGRLDTDLPSLVALPAALVAADVLIHRARDRLSGVGTRILAFAALLAMAVGFLGLPSGRSGEPPDVYLRGTLVETAELHLIAGSVWLALLAALWRLVPSRRWRSAVLAVAAVLATTGLVASVAAELALGEAGMARAWPGHLEVHQADQTLAALGSLAGAVAAVAMLAVLLPTLVAGRGDG